MEPESKGYYGQLSKEKLLQLLLPVIYTIISETNITNVTKKQQILFGAQEDPSNAASMYLNYIEAHWADLELRQSFFSVMDKNGFHLVQQETTSSTPPKDSILLTNFIIENYGDY